MENEKQQCIEHAKLEARFNIWLLTVFSFPCFFIEILSVIVGSEYVPAFIFVAVTYMFIIMFIFMLYKPKERIKNWLKSL